MMTEAQREEEQRQKVRDKALTKANQAGASTAEFDAEEKALLERLGVITGDVVPGGMGWLVR
jgi:hypothetical protein